MSNKQNILFRADSSSTIGTGHVMRNLVLASKYKKVFAFSKIDIGSFEFIERLHE